MFLAVQDSSISDIVCPLVGPLEPTNNQSLQDYNDCSDYNDYRDYRDSDLDLGLDWERFSDLVTQLTIPDKMRNLNQKVEG